MAADLAVKVEEQLGNKNGGACPYCLQWKGKYSKLEEKRNALRQAVKLLEQQLNKVLEENASVKKALEDERARGEDEKKVKDSETVLRFTLEKEIISLRSEISVLKNGDMQSGIPEEVQRLRSQVADGEKEISMLKELLQKEKGKVVLERKNTENEKKNAAEALKTEKSRMDKEKKLAAGKEKKIQEYKLQLDALKMEVDEARSKLAMTTSKTEEASKKLEVEKQKAFREKKRADSEKLKAEEQKRLAEENNRKVVEEQIHAKHLSLQLEEERRKTDEFQKTISELLTSKRLLECNSASADEKVNVKELTKRLEAEKKKASREKKRAECEMSKSVELRQLAEAEKKNAMEQKHRADQLSCKLDDCKQMVDKLQKEIGLSRNSLPGAVHENISSPDIFKLDLLRERLKFEKMQAKHAKQVAKLEKRRMKIVQKEHALLKQEFAHFSDRLEFLDKHFSQNAKTGVTNNQLLKSKKSLQVMQPLQSACGLVKPMHTLTPYNLFRQAEERFTPYPSTFGVKSPESVSGTDLVSPVGGSNREILESSAVNSGAASFSHGQLMASQDRGADSVTTSSDGNPAIIDETNVETNLSEDVTQRDIGNNRKRKRVLSMIGSVKSTSSEGDKSSFQMEGMVSLPQCMLNGEAKDLGKGRSLVSSDLCVSFDGSGKKRKVCHKRKNISSNKRKKNDNFVLKCGGDATFETLSSFERAVEGDYMKLLDLDDPAEEEYYKSALARPLSPYLPAIRSRTTDVCEVDIPKTGIDGVSVGSVRLDVSNEEIASNRLNYSAPGASKLPVMQDGCELNYFRGPENKEQDVFEPPVLNILGSAPWGIVPNIHEQVAEAAESPFQSESRSQHPGATKFCIMVSDIKNLRDISRTFVATRSGIGTCGVVCPSNSVVKKVLQAIAAEDLLPKEKVSVFFSLLLYYFSASALTSSRNPFTKESYSSLDLLAGHISSAFNDVDTIRLLEESFCLSELFSVIQEFLIDGRILVHMPTCSETSTLSDSTVKILLNEINISLYYEAATTEQLVIASLVLASMCFAVDDISFISEASYNILLRHRYNLSLVLTVLHIFAHVCGIKYFTSHSFSMLMTVIKSLVLHMEKLHLPGGSCVPSTDGIGLQFPSCSKCPFGNDAVSIDSVLSLIFERLQNCLLVTTMDQGKAAAHNSCDEESRRVVDPSSEMLCWSSKLQLPSVQSIPLCHFVDILSLVELIASHMSWDWVCNKVVPQLLELLQSCSLDHFSASVIVLLCQLGRLGTSLKGREDSGVKTLRCEISTYVSRYSILQNSQCSLTF